MKRLRSADTLTDFALGTGGFILPTEYGYFIIIEREREREFITSCMSLMHLPQLHSDAETQQQHHLRWSRCYADGLSHKILKVIWSDTCGWTPLWIRSECTYMPTGEGGILICPRVAGEQAEEWQKVFHNTCPSCANCFLSNCWCLIHTIRASEPVPLKCDTTYQLRAPNRGHRYPPETQSTLIVLLCC